MQQNNLCPDLLKRHMYLDLSKTRPLGPPFHTSLVVGDLAGYCLTVAESSVSARIAQWLECLPTGIEVPGLNLGLRVHLFQPYYIWCHESEPREEVEPGLFCRCEVEETSKFDGWRSVVVRLADLRVRRDIDEETVSLREFSTELIVSSAVRCLKTINNDIDLPNSLPGGMSARFRMGTSMASAIQDLGYRGEIGYQTFLYSNEAEIRKVFMFLVDKLPKDTTESTEEPLGASILLQRAISNTVAKQLESPWTPPYLKKGGITWRGKPPSWQREGACAMCSYHASKIRSPSGMADLTRKVPKDLRMYYSKSLPYITNQTVHHSEVAPSILEQMAIELTAQQEWENEWNSQGLASRLSEKDYRARKRQRIQKRLMDTLRQDIKRGQEAAGSRSAQDLQQLIDSISSRGAGTAKGKGSRFTHTEKLVFAKEEDQTAQQIGAGVERGQTEEELQKQREEEVDGLKQDLNSVASRLENLDIDVKKLTAGIQQMEEEITTQARQNTDKEEAFKVKKRTLDLLPDAENNIAKLQQVVDSSAQRLVKLAEQWEKHRVPLIEQFRDLKDLNSKKESEAEKKLEEIKTFRGRMKEVADDARNKEELLKQLAGEYERMTKDINRSAYTKRIMEIVSNIKKQKEEIDKVLVDTKSIQKEINSLSGKLDRTFTVTDELIFRNSEIELVYLIADFQDAKKDEAAKKAYRNLAALHENCEVLIKTVEDTGGIMREIRELEDQVSNTHSVTTSQVSNTHSATTSQVSNTHSATTSQVSITQSATTSQVSNNHSATTSQVSITQSATTSQVSNNHSVTTSQVSNTHFATSSRMSNTLSVTTSSQVSNTHSATTSQVSNTLSTITST
ncbi:hypothetical protein FSP39_009318 [Pinctada imbricata]|uniref:Coiled-coil domain-containing protein 22 homolog n=1 Tax=Pinctada imbricata TaxID=66713 RepID=A0AA89C3H7_PINIB|nr:hypothetical protein FSP39_009318 [Pinctada imbricata]